MVTSKRRAQRGMIEIQLLMAAYGILLAVLFPPLYRNFPVGILGLWLLGLVLARFYCQNLIGESLRQMLGLPLYIWTYLLLSAIPALFLWFELPEGGLLMILQPFLAYRLQLSATQIPRGA
jgi:hypothetical protein